MNGVYTGHREDFTGMSRVVIVFSNFHVLPN